MLLAGLDGVQNRIDPGDPLDKNLYELPPEELAHRVKLVFLLSAVVLSAPLLAFAVYLWSLGANVLRARQFPPPGYRVMRDTPVIGGRAAVSRGRAFKLLALCLGIASVLLWLLLWRFAWVLSGGAA